MKTLVGVLSMVLFFSVQLFSQSTLNKANKQFELKAYESSLENYQLALEADPGNNDIIGRIAACYYQLGNNLQASQWYEQIVNEPGVNPDYLFLYANTLKSLTLYGKAKYYFTKYAQFDQVKGKYFADGCDYAQIQSESPPEYQVEILDINTHASEFSPAITNDKLVFASFRNDIAAERKIKQGSKGSRLYYTPRINTSAKPKYLVPGVQTTDRIGPVSFAAHGNSVAFVKNDYQDGHLLVKSNDRNLSLFIATVKSDGQWVDITPFTHNSNKYSNTFPHLTKDGMTLYFASNKPGGFGGFDLYVSYLVGKEWSEPENLGSVINSSVINSGGDEIAPYKYKNHLYFSSNWHHGLGGYDIFKAASEAGQWRTVYNMGPGINTAKDEIQYIWDYKAETGYVCSNRTGGNGSYDIYRAKPNFREILVKVKDKDQQTALADVNISFASGKAGGVTNSIGNIIIHGSPYVKEEIIIQKEGYHDLKMKLANPSSESPPTVYEVFIEEKQVITNQESIPEEPVEIVQSVVKKQDIDLPGKTVNQDVARAVQNPVVQTSNQPAVDDESPVAEVTLYAIQVAALNRNSGDISKYTHLNKYGTVRGVAEGGYIKVRVGSFENSTAAKAILKDVKRAGYADAYIVKSTANKPISAQTVKQQPYSPVPQSRYKVRLATYAEPGNFDARKVNHLGKVESYKKNKWTIMLLGGYDTLSEAKNAKNNAVVRGFKDAYVVMDNGGVLERVNE
jgi:hypothetical protein